MCIDIFIYFKFALSFWNDFRLTEKLQRHCGEFPGPLHAACSDVASLQDRGTFTEAEGFSLALSCALSSRLGGISLVSH